ncbi:MAG: potassium channel protein [Melioribacteraceae bacterium]|nr:potassium channel protein [Melioribacteraceae bacterium]
MIRKAERKLILGIVLIPAVILAGTIGYMLIEGWDFFDSLYMTVITISTTGYREVHDMSMGGKTLSILLIISGVTTIAYTGGRAVQFLLETQMLRRRRMKRKIEELTNHYIICGYGRMGQYICEGLKYWKEPFVIIENDTALSEQLEQLDYTFIIGDASSDEVLYEAGITKAKGLVAVVSTDAENVFITLSAKELSKKILVVARAIDEKTESKLKKAGADRVVKPYELGGNRMIQLLLRPGVSDFIDVIVRKRGIDIKIEELNVTEKSSLIGQTLATAPIRKELNIMIIAVSGKNRDYTYNPKSSYIIEKGDKLIALGEFNNLQKLEELC